MNETVGIVSMIGMAVTMCISIAVPIILMLIAKKKLPGKLLPVLIGSGTFIVFALVLEQILHFVMQKILGSTLTDNIWLYALYGGLAAGLFEETGRFLSMRFLMKNTLSKQNSIMYGIGHGGAESILLIGLTYLSNLITAVMINSGQLDTILSTIDEPLRTQTREQLSALWTTPAHQFYLASIERLSAIVLQICLSYIIYRAVKERKTLYYLIAVLLHFIADAGIILIVKFTSIYVGECALIAFVVCLAIFLYRKYTAETSSEIV